MTKAEAIKRQNEWAKDNIKPEDRMTCRVCGKIVANNWMMESLQGDVDGRCAHCYAKKK